MIEVLTKHLFGKLFAYKGYIFQNLFEKLWEKSVELVIKRKNVKNLKMMRYYSRFLLRKRAMIESVNNLKKYLPNRTFQT